MNIRIESKKVLKYSLIEAYLKGFLDMKTVINLNSIIKFEFSKDMPATYLSRVSMSSDGITIRLYKKSIKEAYKQKYLINGVNPKSFIHAIELVIEHEVAHVINNINGGSGHDEGFKSIALKLFNHTEAVGRKNV